MWPFKKKIDKEPPLTEREKQYLDRQRREHDAAQALGRHYVDWVEPVKELKRQGKLDEAERILLACVDATERESAINGLGAAPWYYEQLAIIYRKQDRLDDEVNILLRFQKQRHGPGEMPEHLADRLVKASELRAKQQAQPDKKPSR